MPSLCSTAGVCIVTRTGNMLEVSEIRMSPMSLTCSIVVLMVSTLEEFHCITKHMYLYSRSLDTCQCWSAKVVHIQQMVSATDIGTGRLCLLLPALSITACWLAAGKQSICPTTSCFSRNKPTIWLVIFAGTILCETDLNSGFRNFSSFNF